MAIMNAAIALWIYASFVGAIDLGAPIAGCSAVNLSNRDEHPTTPSCRIGNRTTNLIGLADFTPLSPLNLTWTQTLSMRLRDNTLNGHETLNALDFYLSAPGGINLAALAKSSGFGACALFLDPYARVKFGGDNIKPSAGTCADALTADCVNELLAQATKAVSLAVNSSICEAVGSEFRQNLSAQCTGYSFLSDNGWRLQERVLRAFQSGLMQANQPTKFRTDLTAAQPLTSAENSTSNCNPTLSKSYSLSRIISLTSIASSSPATIKDDIFCIAVFYPLSSNASVSSILGPEGPDVQLTCLKLIDESNNVREAYTGVVTGAVAPRASPVHLLLSLLLMEGLWGDSYPSDFLAPCPHIFCI